MFQFGFLKNDTKNSRTTIKILFVLTQRRESLRYIWEANLDVTTSFGEENKKFQFQFARETRKFFTSNCPFRIVGFLLKNFKRDEVWGLRIWNAAGYQLSSWLVSHGRCRSIWFQFIPSSSLSHRVQFLFALL